MEQQSPHPLTRRAFLGATAVGTAAVATGLGPVVGSRRSGARLAELEAGPRDEVIRAARSAVEALEAELTFAKLRSTRRDHLVSRDAISVEERDAATAGEEAMAARLAGRRAELDELETGTRAEVLLAQRARVAELDARLASIDVELEKSALRAPFDGTIVRRDVDEGAVVDAGRPVLRLVETGALEARVGLPPHVAATLAVGDAATLHVGDAALEGRVRALVPELDAPTRTTAVLFDLTADEAGTPVPGVAVRLALEDWVEGDGYWLPTAALTRGTRGLWATYAVIAPEDGSATEDARLERRDLEVLFPAGDRVFVRGPLSDGELVVAEGLHRAVPGQRVRAAD